ncbi:FAD-dependent oxidoreductase, partial [Bacillus cereus]|nr:FAD-dependent oxidoreductase [Bacillus cereus]
LVIGLGCESETFGITGLKKHEFTNAKINATRKISENMEASFAKYADEKRDELVTIVDGGAGFTGIEYVGELAKRVDELCKQYNIPREKGRIICV